MLEQMETSMLHLNQVARKKTYFDGRVIEANAVLPMIQDDPYRRTEAEREMLRQLTMPEPRSVQGRMDAPDAVATRRIDSDQNAILRLQHTAQGQTGMPAPSAVVFDDARLNNGQFPQMAQHQRVAAGAPGDGDDGDDSDDGSLNRDNRGIPRQNDGPFRGGNPPPHQNEDDRSSISNYRNGGNGDGNNNDGYGNNGNGGYGDRNYGAGGGAPGGRDPDGNCPQCHRANCCCCHKLEEARLRKEYRQEDMEERARQLQRKDQEDAERKRMAETNLALKLINAPKFVEGRYTSFSDFFKSFQLFVTSVPNLSDEQQRMILIQAFRDYKNGKIQQRIEEMIRAHNGITTMEICTDLMLFLDPHSNQHYQTLLENLKRKWDKKADCFYPTINSRFNVIVFIIIKSLIKSMYMHSNIYKVHDNILHQPFHKLILLCLSERPSNYVADVLFVATV